MSSSGKPPKNSVAILNGAFMHISVGFSVGEALTAQVITPATQSPNIPSKKPGLFLSPKLYVTAEIPAAVAIASPVVTRFVAYFLDEKMVSRVSGIMVVYSVISITIRQKARYPAAIVIASMTIRFALFIISSGRDLLP